MRIFIGLMLLLLVCVVPAFFTPQDVHHNKKVGGKHGEVHSSKDHKHTDNTHGHGGISAVKNKKELHPPKANALHGQEQHDHHQQQHPTKRNGGNNKHEKHEKEDKDNHKKSVHRKGTPSQRRLTQKKAVTKPARSHKTNSHH